MASSAGDGADTLSALKNLRKSKRISFTNRLKHLKEILGHLKGTKDDILVALNLMNNAWEAEVEAQGQILQQLALSDLKDLNSEAEQHEERAKVEAERAIQTNDNGSASAPGQVTELATTLRLQNQYESKIKPFNGTYKEWPSWIGSFMENVESQPLSDTDKNNILRNCLKGPVKDVAAAFRDLGSTYKTLLEALKKEYYKPLDIMSDLVDELVQFTPCNKEVAENLTKLTNTLNSCLSVFEIYGCEASKHPEAIISIVRSKFPSKTRGAWSKATRECCAPKNASLKTRGLRSREDDQCFIVFVFFEFCHSDFELVLIKLSISRNRRLSYGLNIGDSGLEILKNNRGCDGRSIELPPLHLLDSQVLDRFDCLS